MLIQKDKKGFTLVELLIAIVILGVLAALLSGNFFTSLKKGRDARRKADLEQVQRALELYYEDNRSYPTTLPSSGGQLIGPNGKIYMQKIPADPTDTANYRYCADLASSPTKYQLYAHLENQYDSRLITPAPQPNCNTPNCGTAAACNYGVASSDASP